jgi:hypothetical protein
VELLPERQRDAVLLHYIDGLSCEEIAAVLGSTPGAVRVRLHRARAQLRRELAPVAPTPKEEPMIEMTLDDVVVRVHEDDPSQFATQHVIAVLKEREGERRLPIWMGLPEGAMLAYQLHGASPPRPMTTDLMVELLRVTGADVRRVAITELRESVFYAAISVDGSEVDARPSDALNLAVRTGASILVAEAVLEEAGRTGDLSFDEHESPEAPLGRWSSLTVEQLHALHQFPKEKE